jgi:DNA-binding NarL/FixJ family response regulator
LKDVSLAKFTEAVRTVAAGGTLVSPVVAERLLRGLRSASSVVYDAGYDKLTGREAEILRLMVGVSAMEKLHRRCESPKAR